MSDAEILDIQTRHARQVWVLSRYGIDDRAAWNHIHASDYDEFVRARKARQDEANRK